MPKRPPTQNIEALSSFAQGRALFDSYLETGSWDDLSEAVECFDLAVAQDSSFNTAKFYRAVSRIELGNLNDEDIEDLKALTSKEARRRNRQLWLDAGVQLAHAYASKGKYIMALEQLETAKKGATENRYYLIEAYRALPLALLGEREQASYLWARAIGRASATERKISENDEIGLAARFEAKNAVGTAYLWWCYYVAKRGQTREADDNWTKAETAFLSARALRPNSARVLYNLGRLYICRGDREGQGSAARKKWYERAADIIARSLEINPFDDVALLTKALLDSKIGRSTAPLERGKKWLEELRTKKPFTRPSRR